MRYQLNINKITNELVYFGLRGKILVSLIQSSLQPLQKLNDAFVSYAAEKHIEARMTSQYMYFEWFLNRKLSKYFIEKEDKISLSPPNSLGVPIFGSPNKNTFVVWEMGKDNKESPVFYLKETEIKTQKHSFSVSCPSIVADKEQEFLYALKYWLDRYKTAGKTYLIKLTS